MLARVKGWLTTPSTLRPLQWLAAAVTPVAVRSIQAALKQIICFFFEEEEEEHPPGMSLSVSQTYTPLFSLSYCTPSASQRPRSVHILLLFLSVV